MTGQQRDRDISAVRAFNRAYTERLGLLNSHLDKSPFTLSEARLLYELAYRTNPTAADLGRALGIDRGQISRTLKRFAERGLVATREQPTDGRNLLLALTDIGRQTFGELEANTRAAVDGLLENMTPANRSRFIAAVDVMRRVFEERQPPAPVLREPRPGDLGWVVHRQSTLYAEEYGWNSDYEALAAKILSDFHRSFDASKEAAWIAEIDGRVVGSIFLVKGDEPEVAKLRLLYVEPDVRGSGIAKILVDACIDRARSNGYRRLDLWTNSVLAAARRLYERAGFTLVDEKPHRSFGHDLVGQTFSLAL